jgi:hypothetical protein
MTKTDDYNGQGFEYEQEPMNVPNLDSVTDDGELAELENTFGRLAAYVGHKRQAIKYRLCGDIEAALSYERACDEHYKRLPFWARW